MSKKEYNKVSVYLLATDVKKEKDYFKDIVTGPVVLEGSGNLYYRKPEKVHAPSWVNDFFEGNEAVKNIKFIASDAAAVLITSLSIEDKNYSFAICFGTGHNLLKSSLITKDFGLLAAMKSIEPEHISSVNLTSFESTVKNKRIQSTELTKLTDYSLRRDRDVMKSISGKSNNLEDLDLISNRLINGKDSISLSAKVSLSSIKKLLPQLIKQYNSNPDNGVQYKSTIEKIIDSTEINNLNESLIHQISTLDSRIIITIPELIDEQVVDCFKISGKDDVFQFSINELGEVDSIEKLESVFINAIGPDDDIVKSWTVFDCLLGEVSRNDSITYILQEGQYYKINTSYVEAVEEYYKNVTIEKGLTLKDWDDSKEAKYNEDQSNESILVMDKSLISLGGRSKFEFCDLLSINKQLVHVKILSNSTNISHLFEQGLLSVSVLEDKTKHKVINEIICEKGKDAFKIPDDAKAKDYSVIYVLLCDSNKIDKDGRPQIPFFSKAVFREVHESLKSKEVDVSIMAIKKVKKEEAKEESV